MKASIILASFNSVLPILAIPITRATSDTFGGIAIHSASPIHLSSINAAGNYFWIGKPTSSYCPSTVVEVCPDGKYTYFVNGNETLGLAVEVPGGQRAYVADDGSFGYTIAHGSSGGKVVEYTGFSIEDEGLHLKWKGESWIAVPVDGGSYKVYAAASEQTPKNGIGFAFRIASVDVDFGAWQYA